MDIVTRIASGLLEDELFEAIEINNRERFGNVVFMAGGAGSGKSTTCDKIFDFGTYKFLDVDKLKVQLAPSRGHDISTEAGNQSMMDIINKRRYIDKTYKGMYKSAESDRLPNLVFDATLGSLISFKKQLIDSIRAGYSNDNIHLVWSLLDLERALQGAKARQNPSDGKVGRYVKPEFVNKNHHDVLENMVDWIYGGNFPEGLNGDVIVIDFTGTDFSKVMTWDKQGLRTDGFKKLYLKKSGQPFDRRNLETLRKWLLENIVPYLDPDRISKEIQILSHSM